ncbi:MAG: MarR family transcriptional regulator [Pseudomonadota bacterium]
MTEREALNALRAAFTAGVSGAAPDLTARQSALLLTVGLSAGPHTVRGLAAELDVSKPVISRAVDRLEALCLVRRVRDERDLRSVFIERTPAGSAFLRAMARPILGLGRTKPVKKAA